ncbi:6405_t:CDS:2 [Ambispora leptoticha]|uniref:Protein-serine/threonine kinase n=1 Tax=Ambispora leptoticha TaxID=144679 RepID=A0A9N8VL69_9GLOM|nr:6405_t:CDS:2 [Ambispora leptoticha]
MTPIPSPVLRAVPREVINKLWSQRVTRLSLKHLATVGRHVLETKNNTGFLIPAQFLHQELPIRFSQTLKMLNSPNIPHNMNKTPTFQRFREKYYEYICLLASSPKPDTLAAEQSFTALIRNIQRQNRLNMLSFGQAFRDVLESTNTPIEALDTPETREFFDRFYAMNLGTRILIGEHLALHDEGRNLVQRISPLQVAERAIRDARKTCEKHYKRSAPEVKIVTPSASITTTYIEEHLHRILFELLKNSLRATLEFHHSSPSLPAIKLIIVDGGEDVTIKLSDEGGGIPISASEKVWNYVYSSTPNCPTTTATQNSEQKVPRIIWRSDEEGIRLEGEAQLKINDYTDMPLISYGHGLPVARLTARYFGGDLSLVSMEGYGTDTYLSLYRDDTHLENFPELLSTTTLQTIPNDGLRWLNNDNDGVIINE